MDRRPADRLPFLISLGICTLTSLGICRELVDRPASGRLSDSPVDHPPDLTSLGIGSLESLGICTLTSLGICTLTSLGFCRELVVSGEACPYASSDCTHGRQVVVSANEQTTRRVVVFVNK